MEKKKFPFKRWIIKVVINFIVFVLLLFGLAMTKLPSELDSHVYYKDFQIKAWLLLILYRLVLYVAYPFVLTFIENLDSSRHKVKFKFRLLENFNVEFLTYSIISSLYVLLGVDKILGAELFGASDAFMFIGAFIFTLLLNKTLPHLFYDENDLYTGNPKCYIPSFVDLGTIIHDYDPSSNTRTYFEYEYNNVSTSNVAIVVLKNPSESFSNGISPTYNEKCIDATTLCVMNFINSYNRKNPQKAYKKVKIVNLFPEYSTNPKGINEIYGFKNKERISPNSRAYNDFHKMADSYFANCDVICAWGEPNGIKKMSYDLAIQDMKKHFSSNVLYEYSNCTIQPYQSEYPIHGKMWK